MPEQGQPTSRKRLLELLGAFEVATTDGELRSPSGALEFTGDDIGDVYRWLSWCIDAIHEHDK
jgi:hypothetical protein